MNTETKIISAVDIGTTKIVVVTAIVTENGKLQIAGIGEAPSLGVKRGLVVNIEKTIESIRLAADIAEKQSGIKIKDVYVGIAGMHIRSLRNRGYININPEQDGITQADIERLTMEAHHISLDSGDEIVHVLPQNYIIDNEPNITNPIGHLGNRLEADFHIVISKSTSIMNIKKCITRAGMNTLGVFLEPLASSEAVLTEDEKEVGVAMIDIGGGTSDLAVYHEGKIKHTAVFPIGGEAITADIKKGLNIIEKQADKLKIGFGSAIADMEPNNKIVTIPGISGRPSKEISCKTLAYIIQTRMEEIINQLIYQIEFSRFYDKLGAGIVITGGGSLLRNLPQLVAFKTGYEVRIGYPLEYVTYNAEQMPHINNPKYATAIGLLLKGIETPGKPENHSNPYNIKNEPEQQPEEISLKSSEPVSKQKSKEPVRNKLNDFVQKLSTLFEVEDQKL